MIQFKKIITLFLFIAIAVLVRADNEHTANNNEEEEFDASTEIMHHISDSHNWYLFDLTDKETGEVKPIGVPLPVILIYDGKLDIFMSSEFHEGHSTRSRAGVKYPTYRGDYEYILYHNNIYIAEEGKLNFDEHNHPTNAQPIDLSITKNVAGMMFASILLLVVFIVMANMYKKGNKVPRGIQGFLEPLVTFVVEDIAKPNIGKKYQKYVPYLLTVFFFIWFNNMLGLIPIIPGGANVTGNIAVTLTLAAFTMVITNFSGTKTYWKHIVYPPVPKALLIIMVPVEIIGVLSKPFALMIRLFANITAGHIIVLSLVSLIFIFKTLLISPVSVAFVLFIDIIELLVAILQAYIFTLLSALYIGMALEGEH
jgi:F-type H+-transporting ATPase subunit a